MVAELCTEMKLNDKDDDDKYDEVLEKEMEKVERQVAMMMIDDFGGGGAADDDDGGGGVCCEESGRIDVYMLRVGWVLIEGSNPSGMTILLIAASMLLMLNLLSSPSWYGISAWRLHANHSCHGCAEARDELAKMRLEQIKREILEKLGLDEPPQVRPQYSFPVIPQVAKYLKHYHYHQHHQQHQQQQHHHNQHQQEQLSRHDSTVISSMYTTSFLADELMVPERKTERTIVLAERTPSRLVSVDLILAHFKFSHELMSKPLLSAVLNVYLRKPTKLNVDSRIAAVQILVKEVLANATMEGVLNT
ncbi:unnamed protein product [Thelazia callipaeda]|uniref:TGFb_propeptide domain-containing protein n=1 Tax=Thelazia callipaeda TaxID=103827 RepID=A0A0N5DA16_THECL|nr:unnamed protein product [Thelazia callipaeda]